MVVAVSTAAGGAHRVQVIGPRPSYPPRSSLANRRPNRPCPPPRRPRHHASPPHPDNNAQPRQWRRTALLSAALLPCQPPSTPRGKRIDEGRRGEKKREGGDMVSLTYGAHVGPMWVSR
ncbi:hypothetical protein [Oryza sativa Japonica Group]|uniref:Uncharacterized protein n=1 Tax=Oryza sativa subsp. japonica TaxID=39947 RepID=Q5ZAY4_ORYSJ|nr:hypothetical protein [Oryza sativa Japonica Group]